MDRFENKEKFEKTYLTDYAEVKTNPYVNFEAVYDDIINKMGVQGVSDMNNEEYDEDDEITSFTGTYEYEEVHYGDNNKKKIALYSFDVEYKDGYYTLTYTGV